MVKITDIIPFMNHGWVAMDSNGEWYWYDLKPFVENEYNWCNGLHGCAFDLCMFDIEPVDDWKQSLIKIGDSND